MVASSSPLDQYIVAATPTYFFGRSPESALIDPDNLLVAANHIKCAAFELPFREGEGFGVPRDRRRCSQYLQRRAVLHAAAALGTG